jgi:hypothetical protein
MQMSDKADKILCMFSGGTDSSVAAVFAARRAKSVYLVTYRRFGLFGIERSTNNVDRLRQHFPDVEFIHEIVSFEEQYQQVVQHNRAADRKRFGLMTLSLCGLCPLAMHWRTILLCKEFGVSQVYDGSAQYMAKFPSQNKFIFIDNITLLYAEHGITFETPVFDLDTQKLLFEERIATANKIKGTARDIQPFCSQQVLFSRFADLYLSMYSFEEYERMLKPYYDEKIDFVRGQLRYALA